MVDIIVEQTNLEEPFLYKCPFCINPEIEVVTNGDQTRQTRCKACRAMGPTVRTEKQALMHLMQVYKSLIGKNM